MEMENTYKYIVYQTTNLVNNKIYIGVHKTANPDVFDGYIGCGVCVNAPSTYEKSKTAFQQAVKEFGPDKFRRTTLRVFDTAEEAYSLEAELVTESYLARNDVYNMTLGGSMPPTVFSAAYAYDTQGVFVKEYASRIEAGFDIDCDASTIG